MRSFSHTPSPYPLPAADGPFPRGGAGLEAGSRSPGAGGGGGCWKVGSGPRVSVPSPPMLGPAQEMGLWGPRTGKQAIHHTGWLYVCVCVGGALLPEETGAGPLQSPIKQLDPQMQGWKLGGTSCPLILYCQGLGLCGHRVSRGTMTTRAPLAETPAGTQSARASSSCPLSFPISKILGFW